MGALLAFAHHYGGLHNVARPLAYACAAAMLTYVAPYTWLNNAVANAQGVGIIRNVVSGILWGQCREVFL